MFHTFPTKAASRSRPSSGRADGAAKPFRACDRCRLYRIKCGEKPCPSCITEKARCVTTRKHVSEPAAPIIPAQPTPPPSKPTSPFSQTHDVHNNGSSSSSLYDESSAIPDPVVPLTTFTPHVGPPPQLTRSQHVSLLRFFWTNFQQTVPLVERAVFEALYCQDPVEIRERGGVDGALVDIMMAMALSSTSTERMLGLGSYDQARDASWAFFVRCREALRAAAASVEVLQAHALMAVYLMQTGDCAAAYYMIGISIRKAHVLSMHRAPGPNVPPARRSAHIRLYWLLSSLDLACSLQLNAPPAYHASVTCPLPDPGDDCQSATWEGLPASACQAYLARLAAVLNEIGVCELVIELLNEHNSATDIESWTRRLPQAFDRLQQWREELPASLRMRLTDDSNPTLDLDMPAWVERQRTLIDLVYHSTHLLLLRPFFYNAALATAVPGLVVQHTKAALGHAMHIISTLHAICSDSDRMDSGIPFIHALWTATVFIAANMANQPLSVDSLEAFTSLFHARQVLQWLGSRWPLAARALDALQVLESHVGTALPILDDPASLWDFDKFSFAKTDLVSPRPSSPSSTNFDSYLDISTWLVNEPMVDLDMI